MDNQINEKIKALLADPDSLNSILSVASLLGASSNSNTNNEEKEEPSPTNDKKEQDTNALQPLAALASVSKAQTPDDRVNLLLSIKPFLSDRKRKRVDSLVKALGAAKLISAYKDVDIFSKLGL